MDNHLAASWCWLNKIDLTQQYNLLHIDRHYDLLDSQIDDWVNSITNQQFDMQTASIVDLIELRYSPELFPSESSQVFRWDNYITIFNQLYPKVIDSYLFATHKDGSSVDDLKVSEVDSWDLQENLSYWLTSKNDLKWVVNVDIDYFFTNHDEKNYFQLFSDDFVIRIADELRVSLPNIEVLTIALSPEMCGGWQNAERAASLITQRINVDWPL